MNDPNSEAELDLASPLASSAGDAGGNYDRIGDMLYRSRLITPGQAEEIAAHARKNGYRFGESAVALGIIDQKVLEQMLATQFDLLSPDEGSALNKLSVFAAPNSVQAEDFRSLRNALALRWFKHPQGASTLAVISAQHGDGRSMVAANLAACFAQVGFRTLLVDGDMRNPCQHRVFNLDDRLGLSGYLAERLQELPLYELDGITNLSVMPVGGLPPNPQELLLRDRLRVLVRQAVAEFEIVIFDTPAASACSDYQLIAAELGGALLVTRRDWTQMRMAKRLANQCREFGIRLVGSTMVGDG